MKNMKRSRKIMFYPVFVLLASSISMNVAAVDVGTMLKNNLKLNDKAVKIAEETFSSYKKNMQHQEKKFLHHSNHPKLLGKNYIYIFMSSSIPLCVWQNYAKAIAKLREKGQGNIGIVLRGCLGGCEKVLPTVKFILKATTNGKNGKRLKVPVLIDPFLFRLYEIKQVPVFVYAKGVSLKDMSMSPGYVYNLKKKITAYKVLGDCSFSYALQQLYRQSGDVRLLKLYKILTQSWFEDEQ